MFKKLLLKLKKSFNRDRYPATNPVVKKHGFPAGFTLVEILTSMAVFSIIMATAGSVFYFMFDSWRRQRSTWDMLEGGQWAMEFMVNELRYADASGVKAEKEKDGASDPKKEVIRFNTAITGSRVRYWLGDGGHFGTLGVLYRGVGNGFGTAISSRRELARFIANNDSDDGDYQLFTNSNDLINITIVIRPHPEDPDGKNNRSFTLKTSVRARSE